MNITQSGTFFNNGTEARPRGPPPRGPVPLRGLNPMPMGMPQGAHFGSFSSGTAVSRVGTYTGGDQQMPSFRPMMHMGQAMDPTAHLFPAMLKKVANLKEDEELWVSATSPDGKEYFYKTITRETVWEKPENAVIIDQARLTELIEQANEALKKEMAGNLKSGTPNNPWNEFTSPDGRKYYYNNLTQETTWEKPKALQKETKKAEKRPAQPATPDFKAAPADELLADIKPFRPQDSSRPVSSNAVVGTPWCVVWTGDSKVFFFNPTTRTSVWERPPELYNRPDVDMLISKPPVKKVPKASNANGQNANHGQPEPLTQVVQADNNSDVEMEEASSDEEVQPPPKRNRKQSGSKSPAPTKPSRGQSPAEKPIDPAVQAELDAQRERQETPLEERLGKFKEMLEEKEVSVGSTFEKELSKIVFDKRYLLLSATERRAAFESYVKEKAEIERSERKRKLKENKHKFRELLEEAKLRSSSSFSSFARTYGRDDRFKCIERMRDREDLFKDFTHELEKTEREERKQKKQKARDEFLELLKEAHEKACFDRHVKWSTVKKALEDDVRYCNKHLSSDTREDIFRKFLADLPPSIGSDEEEQCARAEQAQSATASELAIENRKKAVEAELDETMKERLRESEKHKIQEHEENFKALLADVVKSTDSSWRDVRKTIRKDTRYADCDLLDKDAKEKLYNEHVRSLENKKRESFFQLLTETEGINFKLSWRDARKIMEKEKRFAKFDLRDRYVEDDFRDWRDLSKADVCKNFTELLKETKIITYKSVELIQESEQHLKDILAVLENDKRYLVMNCIPNEREKLLEKYLKEIADNGPPPPPTQQEGERDRKRK